MSKDNNVTVFILVSLYKIFIFNTTIFMFMRIVDGPVYCYINTCVGWSGQSLENRTLELGMYAYRFFDF